MMRQTRITIGAGADENEESAEHEENEKFKEVHVKKINNGVLVSTCGFGGEETEFVKSLAAAPKIMARLMGIKDKNYAEMKRSTQSKDIEEKSEK